MSIAAWCECEVALQILLANYKGLLGSAVQRLSPMQHRHNYHGASN